MAAWLNKNKIQDRVFAWVWGVVIVVAYIRLSAWHYMDLTLTLHNVLLKIEYAACAVCLIIIIFNFICRKYSWKIVVGYILLAVVVCLPAYFADNKHMVFYFLVFGAAYGQDSRKLITISAAVSGFMILMLVVFSKVGIAPNPTWIRVRDDLVLIREGLGFHYTSTGPTVFIGFIFQYIYLRKERLRFWEPLILEAVSVYFFLKTDSRMSFFLGTIFLAFFLIESLFKNHWKITRRLRPLGMAAPGIVGVGTIVCYLVYNSSSGIWQAVDQFLTGRLALGAAAIQTYGINLVGHDITWIGNGIFPTDAAYNYVDCSYIQLMLSYGALFIIAVIAIYVIAAIKAVKINDFTLVWVLFFVSVYAVAEPYLVNLAATPLIILAFSELNGEPLVYTRECFREVLKT